MIRRLLYQTSDTVKKYLSFTTILIMLFFIGIHLGVFYLFYITGGNFQKICFILMLVVYDIIMIWFWYALNTPPSKWDIISPDCPDYYTKTENNGNVTCSDMFGSNKSITYSSGANLCTKRALADKNNIYWDGVSNLNKDVICGI